MSLVAKPMAIDLDTATPDWDTGAPTYAGGWDADIEFASTDGMNREEIDASTADHVVKKSCPGAWNFPVAVNFNISTGAQRKAWNAAVSAGTAVAYRIKMDANAAASDDYPWIFGAFMPNGLILAQDAHGGIVKKNVTLTPSGVEPYIKVTYTAGDVYYGKT